jgi:hypothetical protein
MIRLDRIHGVWRNVCCLGVGSEGVWGVISAGWAMVLDTMTGRERVVTRAEVEAEAVAHGVFSECDRAVKEERMDESA